MNELKDGVKYDQSKLRYDLLPPDTMDDIADIFTYGAAKYADRNWEKGMDWGRIFAATMRHLWSFWRGEDYDKESGKHHLAHAATNVIFLLTYYKRQIGKDTRK